MRKCASVALSPVLAMLWLACDAANLIIELQYYGIQAMFNLAQIVVMAMVNSMDGTVQAAKKLMLYIRLFLGALVNVLELLYGAMFKIVFGYGAAQQIVSVMYILCQTVQFLEYWVVKRGFCVVLQKLSDFFNSLTTSWPTSRPSTSLA